MKQQNRTCVFKLLIVQFLVYEKQQVFHNKSNRIVKKKTKKKALIVLDME